MGTYIYPISENFLNLSGGTVTGNTYFQANLSADTIFSGSTELSSLFLSSSQLSRIQNGLNTYTGGTVTNPTVNISGATLDNIFVSGNSVFSAITASTINIQSASTASPSDFFLARSSSGEIKLSSVNSLSASTSGITGIGTIDFLPKVFSVDNDNNIIRLTNSKFKDNGNYASVTYTGDNTGIDFLGSNGGFIGRIRILNTPVNTGYISVGTDFFGLRTGLKAEPGFTYFGSWADEYVSPYAYLKADENGLSLGGGLYSPTKGLMSTQADGSIFVTNDWLLDDLTNATSVNIQPTQAEIKVYDSTTYENLSRFFLATTGITIQSPSIPLNNPGNLKVDSFGNVYSDSGGSSSSTTYINNGLNTYTGGTATNPTVNISGGTLDNIFVSGNSVFSAITASTITTPVLIGGSEQTSGIIYSASSNSAVISSTDIHTFKGGNSGATTLFTIKNSGAALFNSSASSAATPAYITKNFAIIDADTSFQFGDAGLSPGDGNLWIGGTTPTTSNYSIASNGSSYLTLNNPTALFFKINDTEIGHMTSSRWEFTPSATTAGSTQLLFTAAAHSGLTASTDVPAINFNLTANRQFATGAKTSQTEFLIQAPTYSAVGATTITDAYTFVVSGSPTPSTNITITNRWAAWLNGFVRVGPIAASGMVFRNDVSSNNYSAIYNAGITPSSSNYFIKNNGSTTLLNASTGGATIIAFNGTGIISVGSTMVTLTQTLSLRAGSINGGTAPLYFNTTAASLLTTPQTAAMEVSSEGQLFYTQTGGTGMRNFIGLDSYTAKTSNYTATTLDHTIDCTTGTFTVTLPTAAASVTDVPAGRIYRIINTGTGVITIDTTGGQTINGAASQSLSTQYSGISLQSTGTNWIIISKYS